MHATTISGTNLTLAPIGVDAIDKGYAEWMHDDSVLQYLEARFADRSPDALKAFVTNCNDSADQLLFGIFVDGGRRYIGNLKLTLVRLHNRAEIGLLIGPADARGRGYGTEAIRLLTDFAFSELEIEKVTAGCYATNVGSIRAFQRAGFEIEATRRAHYQTEQGRVDGVYLCRFAPDRTPPR